VLCDTNGGSLPADVERIVGDVYDYFGRDVGLGIHVHDDTGCAVANTIAGVRGGARQVQGTINGIGERTGNANLTTIIPDLTLKMGVGTIPNENLERLTAVSHHVAELVNVNLNPQAAYVGQSAFAHKAGLHVSAIARRPDAYEHVDPDLVGNGRKFVVSELAGKTTLDIKAKEIGLDLDGGELTEVVAELKELENRGYHFEAADGSLELLMRRATGWRPDYFTIQQYRVMVDGRAEVTAGTPADLADVFAEATIKLEVDGRRVITTAEGNGPVDALNQAMREAIGSTYPALQRIHLTDFKVRILETGDGTAAVTRVLLDSTNGERTWSTIGVSENIIEASWEALLDSLVFGLLHTT
jgi:2-isopropylmalate synthase